MTLVYVDIYLTIWNAIGLYTFVRFWTNEAEANERWDFMGGQVPVRFHFFKVRRWFLKSQMFLMVQLIQIELI